MLRRIYCYVLTQRVIGNWDAHSQGSVKHQLPIVAVIASGQLLQGVYLRTIVIRGEIPWSGVVHLWCWKGGRCAGSHIRPRLTLYLHGDSGLGLLILPALWVALFALGFTSEALSLHFQLY